MANDYIELILTLTPYADVNVARQWFEQHALIVTPMVTGLLISGSKSRVEQALSISLDHVKSPADLPIPRELTKHVAAIRLPKPRSYHV